ncbi:DUF4920 domain-containing protein [Desulfosediminicola sp.]|uniref:DUF4920 domain-containing protein n=1 Tax=Desulfosediminicola sp. TaxID=2886825 RepID=UPI003AF2BCAB
MKRITLLFLAATLLFTGQAFAKTYGNGISEGESTAISRILDAPDEYLGKIVRVEGLIIEVCAKRGCWIYVAGDRPNEKIQVKVTDGEIVFPMSATGRVGIIEGIVDEVKLSREELIKYQQHLAEEKGKPFDPASIDEGTRFIRLIGLGAEINE